MATAEVLIHMQVRYDNKVVEELKKINGVRNVHVVYGSYDIVAKLEGKDKTALENILFLHIRRLHGIRSTSPLIQVADDWPVV